MGCVYSSGRNCQEQVPNRTNANGRGGNSTGDATSIPLNQRSFHVFNVDERGNEMHEGTIEITSNDLIYKHLNDPLPIYWPLCSLRKYGYNADLFSFVCGRRCPTGPGIYAFKCSQALELFELLDESLKGLSSANFTAANTPPSVSMARNSANQWPQYRQISALALVPCRNPIPLTSTNTSTAAAATGTVATVATSTLTTTSSSLANATNLPATNTNDNPSCNSELDNVKLPAYYVNVSTCDPSNVSPTGAKLNSSAAATVATSQYVNTEAEVFASVHLASPSSSGTNASPDKVKSSSLADYSNTNITGHNGKDATSKIHSVDHNHHSLNSFKTQPSTSSQDANSNITSTKQQQKSPNEHLSYILLDLDPNTNGPSTGNSVYVTAEPVTPVNRSPKEEITWTPPEPGTPHSLASVNNSNSNTFQPPYAQIDFEKTDALNTAASIKKG